MLETSAQSDMHSSQNVMQPWNSQASWSELLYIEKNLANSYLHTYNSKQTYIFL